MKYYNLISSILFHPLVLLFGTCYYLIIIDPAKITFQYNIIDHRIPKKIFGQLVLAIIILPCLTTFLLWRLKFINNIKMDTAKNRILPFMAILLFTFWTWWGIKNQTGVEPILIRFLLGLFISLSCLFILNPFVKISLPLFASIQYCIVILQYDKFAKISVFPALSLFLLIFVLLWIKKTTTKFENPLALLIGLLAQLIVFLF